MSEDAKWILGIGIPIFLALAGLLWTTFSRRLDSEIKALWDQVGRDSNSGMRKTVHDNSNRAQEALMTCSDQEHRLDRLERKVFNGHRGEER